MDNANNARQSRFTSHALVEVRKYKHLPFSVHSAVLLDLSKDGFKAEFTSEVFVKKDSKYYISIPLRPLGILSPKKWTCLVVVKWFDPQRFRLGGILLKQNLNDQAVISKIISSLK